MGSQVDDHEIFYIALEVPGILKHFSREKITEEGIKRGKQNYLSLHNLTGMFSIENMNHR